MISAYPLKALQALLPLAFAEDEGPGDVTTEATVEPGHRSQATLLCKEEGVLAGSPALEAVFRFRAFAPRVDWEAREGEAIRPGQVLARLEGETRDFLVCERIALNLLQRSCGIATATRAYVQAAGARTRILDTRKTPPGYRLLDKYAVAVGGGLNHRQGLFDQVLVKDNHAAACGSARAAVEKVAARFSRTYSVEAEARNLEEVEALLTAPLDGILLDNMDDKELKKAVEKARAAAPHLKLEASGGMDLERVRALRKLGLDFISVGALTHSVKALDLSLKLRPLGVREAAHGRR